MLLRHRSHQERDPVRVALHPMRSQLEAIANHGHPARTDTLPATKVEQSFLIKLRFKISSPVDKQCSHLSPQRLTTSRKRLPTRVCELHLTPIQAPNWTPDQLACHLG